MFKVLKEYSRTPSGKGFKEIAKNKDLRLALLEVLQESISLGLKDVSSKEAAIWIKENRINFEPDIDGFGSLVLYFIAKAQTREELSKITALTDEMRSKHNPDALLSPNMIIPDLTIDEVLEILEQDNDDETSHASFYKLDEDLLKEVLSSTDITLDSSIGLFRNIIPTQVLNKLYRSSLMTLNDLYKCRGQYGGYGRVYSGKSVAIIDKLLSILDSRLLEEFNRSQDMLKDNEA